MGANKAGMAQVGRAGEPLAGFYFYNPPCSLGPLGCLGVLSFPPAVGQKVNPACPGTQPSDSTRLTKKRWFQKQGFFLQVVLSVVPCACLTEVWGRGREQGEGFKGYNGL